MIIDLIACFEWFGVPSLHFDNNTDFNDLAKLGEAVSKNSPQLESIFKPQSTTKSFSSSINKEISEKEEEKKFGKISDKF